MKAGAGCHYNFNRVIYLVAGFYLGAGIGYLPSFAEAANVTIIVKTSERLEFDDNITRSVNSAGNVYSSLSTINADIAWRMPRLELTASSGTSIRKNAGPGKTDNLNSIDPNLTLGLVKRGITSQFSLSTSFRAQNSSFSELEDTDITNQNTDRLTFDLNSGWTYNINATNTFSLTGGLTVVEFTKSNTALTPFIDFSTQARWVRNLTNLTSVNGTLGWRYFKADNVQKRQSNTFSVSTGVSTRLTPRLSINADAGLDLTKTDQNQIVLGVKLGRPSDLVLGFQTNLAVDYTLRNTQISFTAQQGLEPSAEGRLNQRSSLGFGISHQVNERSSLAWSTSFSRREAASDTSSDVTNFFSVSPTYTYKLARDWNALLGYNFTYRKSDSGTAVSNKIFVSLSKSTTIDP